jgi:hypothetical protein
MVAEATGGPERVSAAERGQPPDGHRPRPLERVAPVELAEHRVDDLHGHPAGPELGPQPRGAVSARRPGRHPLPSEGRVIEMSAGEEIVHDGGGDVGGRAPATQPAGELRTRPGPAGQQIGGSQPGTTLIERRFLCSYRRAKAPAASSPVEKMPRTLRSKSSGLEAVSFAVS